MIQHKQLTHDRLIDSCLAVLTAIDQLINQLINHHNS